MSDALHFIQVGELVKGISEGTLPPADELAGSSLALHVEDGRVVRLEFATGGAVSWRVTEGPGAGERGEERCLITRPREGVFMVDYVSSTRPATSVTIVLDLQRQAATLVAGTLPTAAEAAQGAFTLATAGAELTLVRCEILRAAVDRPFTAADHPHVPTGELLGKRVQYVYSPTEKYEHIYLNEHLYTWQCLAGSEKGLADTDRCHYRRIGDELYLFVWREKVIPTLGVVVVDWRAKRSNGKLFGYESSDFVVLSNTAIASVATLLNVTSYV
jgi:hypothetical protein